jgi:hypothetical protein
MDGNGDGLTECTALACGAPGAACTADANCCSGLCQGAASGLPGICG